MTKQRLIFVVDDDAMYREMLELYLSDNPLNTVKSFPTGEECLKHLTEAPDYIILDYKLDAVDKNAADGIKILDKIRKKDWHTRVIMLSKHGQYNTALQSIKKGAEMYVIKDAHAFKKIDELMEQLW
jgi:DNA-binding NarL/FixJ family response regulator